MARDTLIDFFHDLAHARGDFLVHDDGFKSRTYTYAQVGHHARAFAALTEVPWVAEDAFAPDALAGPIATVLGSETAWHTASERIRRAARPEAAVAVVHSKRIQST